jgi:1,4-dihydroxy-2-naphthoyl-CoA hydrolase
MVREARVFLYQTKIKLHETDAAGTLFFSNQFKIIHDAYESLLESIGFGFAELLRNRDFFLPIVHSESDFKMPICVGDVLKIQVRVEKIGTTSFCFAYKLFNAQQQLVGTAQTVHVTIDTKTRQKIPLPEGMRRGIGELYTHDRLFS